MAGIGDAVSNTTSMSPGTFFKEMVTPTGQVKHLKRNLKYTFPGTPKPEAPKLAPVQEMPMKNDSADLAAKRKKTAELQARSGRESTILSNDALGN